MHYRRMLGISAMRFQLVSEAAFYQINIMIKNSPTQSQSCASEMTSAFHLRKGQESVTCNNPVVWSSDSTSATHMPEKRSYHFSTHTPFSRGNGGCY